MKTRCRSYRFCELPPMLGDIVVFGVISDPVSTFNKIHCFTELDTGIIHTSVHIGSLSGRNPSSLSSIGLLELCLVPGCGSPHLLPSVTGFELNDGSKGIHPSDHLSRPVQVFGISRLWFLPVQIVSGIGSLSWNGSQVGPVIEFDQTFKEERIVTPLKFFHKIETKGTFPNPCYDDVTILLIPKPHKDSKNKNYIPVSLMNTDAKIIKKILTD
ncbi:hypothetical protein STEG23_034175 [Scotinomys teguina]